MLAAVAVATTAAVAVALRARAVPARPTPGRWPRAITAGTIGLGLGLMLVLDRTVGFTEGAVPALALLPSTVASAWGGHHLRHLEQAIPRSVSGIAASDPYARGVAWPPFSVLLGALGRLLLLAAALSLVLLALTPWLGASARGAGLLLGFGLVALATLLVSLLEAMGRGRWALVAVACAVAAETAVRLAGSDPFSGHRPRRRRLARHRPRAARRSSASSSARLAPWPPRCGSHERRGPTSARPDPRLGGGGRRDRARHAADDARRRAPRDLPHHADPGLRPAARARRARARLVASAAARHQPGQRARRRAHARLSRGGAHRPARRRARARLRAHDLRRASGRRRRGRHRPLHDLVRGRRHLPRRGLARRRPRSATTPRSAATSAPEARGGSSSSIPAWCRLASTSTWPT